MIGIGLIGGKALGMLLARAILKQHSPRLCTTCWRPTIRSTSARTSSTRS